MSGDEDLKAFRVDPLSMMGGPIGGPAVAPAEPAAPAGAKSTGYRTFEAALDDKARFDALVARIEKTTRRLEEIAAKGSAKEKSDARKALMAYEHASELLRMGMEEVARIRKQRAEELKARAERAMGKR